mmetsp:Transcript_13877/g.38379  ORF Transcript_13877/g.38379 Transcript_13877/m.38379 type:complete len:86 (+) Transcript_13877:501-758(+)
MATQYEGMEGEAKCPTRHVYSHWCSPRLLCVLVLLPPGTPANQALVELITQGTLKRLVSIRQGQRHRHPSLKTDSIRRIPVQNWW